MFLDRRQERIVCDHAYTFGVESVSGEAVCRDHVIEESTRDVFAPRKHLTCQVTEWQGNPRFAKDLHCIQLVCIVNNLLSCILQQKPGRNKFWIVKVIQIGILFDGLPVNLPSSTSHTIEPTLRLWHNVDFYTIHRATSAVWHD